MHQFCATSPTRSLRNQYHTRIHSLHPFPCRSPCTFYLPSFLQCIRHYNILGMEKFLLIIKKTWNGRTSNNSRAVLSCTTRSCYKSIGEASVAALWRISKLSWIEYPALTQMAIQTYWTRKIWIDVVSMYSDQTFLGQCFAAASTILILKWWKRKYSGRVGRC